MRVEELKAVAASLTEEERIWLSAYLLHLSRADSASNKADLSARNRSIDEGHYVTLEQFEKIHEALEAEGL
jgi:hypothetical protein